MTRRRIGAGERGRTTLVVLAKHPIAGTVKTRLAAAIGMQTATRLHAAFVRDLARRLGRTGRAVYWAYAPPGAPFRRLVGTARVFPQLGRTLGARIHHALRRVQRAEPGPCIALGADAPHVPLGEIERAARRLERGLDVVAGPACDGGYYLIGVRRADRALFRGVPWSTPKVLGATRRRARKLGLSWGEVGVSFDVDEESDLRRLARIVARRPEEFPATARALARARRGRPTRR